MGYKGKYSTKQAREKSSHAKIRYAILTVVLALALCLGIIQNQLSKIDQIPTSTQSAQWEAPPKVTDTPEELSESEKISLAKDAALGGVAEYLVNKKSDLSFYQYDVSLTRGSVGSVEKSGLSSSDRSVYNVNGKLSFYDKYGSYKNSGTFTVTVRVDNHDKNDIDVTRVRVDPKN